MKLSPTFTCSIGVHWCAGECRVDTAEVVVSISTATNGSEIRRTCWKSKFFGNNVLRSSPTPRNLSWGRKDKQREGAHTFAAMIFTLWIWSHAMVRPQNALAPQGSRSAPSLSLQSEDPNWQVPATPRCVYIRALSLSHMPTSTQPPLPWHRRATSILDGEELILGSWPDPVARVKWTKEADLERVDRDDQKLPH